MSSIRYAYVDDRDPNLSYGGKWTYTSSDNIAAVDGNGQLGPTFNGTLTQTSETNASVSFPFDGTGVGFYGTITSDTGMPSYVCTVDGVPMPSDAYSGDGFVANRFRFCFNSPIPDGHHTAELTMVDVSANDLPLLFDYILYQPTPDMPLNDTTEVVYTDDAQSRVRMSTGWTEDADLDFIFSSSRAGSTITLTFEGESFTFYGFIMNGTSTAGSSSYTVDGGDPISFAVPASRDSEKVYYNHPYITHTGLTGGSHAVVITDETDHISEHPLTVSKFTIRGSPSPDSDGGNEDGGGLSTSAIIGIVVGVAVAAIIVIGLLIFFLVRKRRRQKAPKIPESEKYSQPPLTPSSAGPLLPSPDRPTSSYYSEPSSPTSHGTPHFQTLATPPPNSPALMANADYQYLAQNAYQPAPPGLTGQTVPQNHILFPEPQDSSRPNPHQSWTPYPQ